MSFDQIFRNARTAGRESEAVDIGIRDGMADCLDMTSASRAKLMNLKDCGIEVGKPADIVVPDCESRAKAVAEWRRRCSP